MQSYYGEIFAKNFLTWPGHPSQLALIPSTKKPMLESPLPMRLFLLVSMAACLLPVSLSASTKQQKIDLRYRSVAEATEEVAKYFGAEGTSAILTTDQKRNTITLRLDAPSATKVGAFLTAIDRKRELVEVRMTISRKTKATAGVPAGEETLAAPLMIGTPGKPMIVSFERGGETFQIGVNATVLKP